MNLQTNFAALSFLIGMVFYSSLPVFAQYDIESSNVMQSETSSYSKFVVFPLIKSTLRVNNAFIQNPLKSSETKEFYLHKAKNKNTAGWVLLLGGTAMTVVGAIGFNSNFDIWSVDKAQTTRTDLYGVILTAGVIADIVSIPIFISAHRYKKMASVLSLGNPKIYHPRMNSYTLNTTPSFILSLNF